MHGMGGGGGQTKQRSARSSTGVWGTGGCSTGFSLGWVRIVLGVYEATGREGRRIAPCTAIDVKGLGSHLDGLAS